MHGIDKAKAAIENSLSRTNGFSFLQMKDVIEEMIREEDYKSKEAERFNQFIFQNNEIATEIFIYRQAAKELREFLAKKEAEKLAAKKKVLDAFTAEAEEDDNPLETGMLNALYPNLSKGLGTKNGKKKSYIIHPNLVKQLIIKVQVMFDLKCIYQLQIIALYCICI